VGRMQSRLLGRDLPCTGPGAGIAGSTFPGGEAGEGTGITLEHAAWFGPSHCVQNLLAVLDTRTVHIRWAEGRQVARHVSRERWTAPVLRASGTLGLGLGRSGAGRCGRGGKSVCSLSRRGQITRLRGARGEPWGRASPTTQPSVRWRGRTLRRKACSLRQMAQTRAVGFARPSPAGACPTGAIRFVEPNPRFAEASPDTANHQKSLQIGIKMGLRCIRGATRLRLLLFSPNSLFGRHSGFEGS
jgi:hypothetical protein